MPTTKIKQSNQDKRFRAQAGRQEMSQLLKSERQIEKMQKNGKELGKNIYLQVI